MSALSNEDWMFDSLLEGAPERTVRLCRLYEFAREVTDYAWTEKHLSLGQLVMMLTHQELFTPFFWFCVTKPGWSREWLRVPYFKLSSRIRDQWSKLYDSHLAALIDPAHSLHDTPFLPVGSGPPFTNVPHQEARLDIPLVGSSQFVRECLEAFLHSKFPQEDKSKSEGGKAEIRRLKNELRYLGALRVLRHKSAKDAIRHTTKVLGQPLYAHPSHWSRAKRQGTKIIKSFENELKPIKELFARAPRDITSAQYDPATGRLTYS